MTQSPLVEDIASYLCGGGIGWGAPPDGGAASGAGPLLPELDGGGVVECCGAEYVAGGE